MKNKLNKITIFITSGLIILIIGFIIWSNNSYKPTGEAIEALNTNGIVTVTEEKFIEFEPKEKATKGFIFYPGGKVEAEAYSTLARKISEEGYLVVIAPMTLDLAVLSPNKATDITEKFDYIETWAIGGHSLGGVMAASYAAKNESIDGVVLYASYPQGEELKDLNIKVLSMYGSNDGVADIEKVKNAVLSKDSEVVEIKGGNHGGFGSYGTQKGDNEATITGEEQIEKSAKYTVEFLESLK
ncbi:alpha/beta family hydrolase [Clostridium sp.]|uniref:alpha/beta family hydrolase n=1 Tax=Clostridium sp. TaxID=1506 RepID=UPI002606F021|nr:alpha/beta family hydrolase [Clostridium sp.]